MSRVSAAVCVAIMVVAASACGGGTDEVPELVDARVSPDGKLVAYAARDGDDLDLFVVSPAGGRPRLVAGSGRSEHAPVWSPDSTRLAYVVADEYAGARELWVVRADGGRGVQLTQMTSRDHEWSPDGRRLAFASDDDADDDEAGGRLFVVEADGRGLRPVASGRMGDRPRWSPDGELIAFWSGRVDDEFRDRGDLYVVTVETGRVRRLTRRGDVERYTAAWSPDGARILYTREVDDLLSEIVEIVEARGGDVRRVRAPVLLWARPVWSPDGRWIAFDEGDGVTVSSADGSGTRYVDRRGMGSGHTWSRHSRLIAYDTYGGLYEPIPTDVVVASRDGSPRNVTHTPMLSETFAGWLADGRHLVGVREERSLWVFDLSGRGRRLVQAGPAPAPG